MVEDVLAAVEWQTTILPLLLDWNIGDVTLIDLRDRTEEEWRKNRHLSLSRGIAALRAPARPIWCIQRADQQVEKWGLESNLPIFTQHSEGQFEWMLEAFLSPDWTASYADHCGLIMCAELEAKCREASSGPP